MAFIKRHGDWLASLLLIAAALGYAVRYVNFGAPPFEDAAMLMRYADHLAHGYGIVWNIGERPIDGATDFLFMVASAALIKIGVPVGRSVRALGFGSHLVTVLLVYWVNRKIWKANIALSFVTGLYLAVGTGFTYAAAYFGTPFFALFATLTWMFALLLIKEDQSLPGYDAPPDVPTQSIGTRGIGTRNKPSLLLSWLFAVSALLTGLIRPEGVILAVLMLTAVVVLKGWRASTRTVLIFAGTFLLLGGAYFLWRWSYFGYPLPNPFYKKGGGLLHWDSFWESLGNLLRFGGPFLLAFLLGFRSNKTARMAAAFLISFIVFAAAFILVSNETNFGGRFQYALWPLVLISWVPLVDGLGAEVRFSWPRPAQWVARGVWLLTALSLIYGLVRYSMLQNCSLTSVQQSCGIAYEADGRYDLAKMLSDYQGKGYVIATSEAGLLPFYSNWAAVDTWGLNDEWIAHHGEVTAEYLDQRKPDVIAFHAYFSPLVPPKLIPKNMAQDWFRMTITLKDYAESHGYILAAAFGDSPYEAHYYYVRPDFPDSQKIVHDITTMKSYYWWGTGRKAINYSGVQP